MSLESKRKTRPKAALFASQFCPIYLSAYEHWNPLAQRSGASSKGKLKKWKQGDATVSGVPVRLLDDMLGNKAAGRAVWRHGGAIQASTIDEIASHLEDAWLPKDDSGASYAELPTGKTVLINKVLGAIQDDHVTFSAFAELVGLSKEIASQIVDYDYFIDTPLLTDMYYKRRSSSKSTARKSRIDSDFETLKGYYVADIGRKTKAGNSITLRLKIHVKYVFDYQEKHLIRTKLKIPYYVDENGAELNPDPETAVGASIYDGWVRLVRKGENVDGDGDDAAGDHVVWLFQKRRDRGKVDFEFIITEPQRLIAGVPTLEGRFLTLDQEGRIDSGPIKLIHVSDNDDPPDFMDTVTWSYDQNGD